jgi:hypothetical protein
VVIDDGQSLPVIGVTMRFWISSQTLSDLRDRYPSYDSYFEELSTKYVATSSGDNDLVELELEILEVERLIQCLAELAVGKC